MGRLRVLVVVFALVSGLFGAFAAFGANAAVAPGDEDGFVGRVAAERSAAGGLEGYAVADDLVAVARRHAARMAAEQRLYHNPSLGSDVTGWSAVGENVGVGASVEDVHRAFMASAPHRHAILSDEFTQVGVGVEVDGDGSLWVVEVFRRPVAPASATAPASAAPPQEDRGPTVRAASSRRSGTAAPVHVPAAVTAPDAPVAPPAAAAAPVATAPLPPPVDPEAPAVVGTVAAGFDRASARGVLVSAVPRPIVAAAVPVTALVAPPHRAVTAPVGVAASLLLLVVLGLLVEVGRYPATVSVWRRQRNQASISSSRSPSSTAWTLPVS